MTGIHDHSQTRSKCELRLYRYFTQPRGLNCFACAAKHPLSTYDVFDLMCLVCRPCNEGGWF